MALISQFSAFSYKGRALSFPQASLCRAVERKRAGNVGKEKGQEGGVRPLSSVPHEPSCFLFLTSSAPFTCLIILFSFLEYHWQPLRKRENQARTIFFKIRKNKQTNKCSKAGRDITRTWWTLVLSEHGPYFHTRVLGESAKRQSADTFTRHRRIRSVLYHISRTYNTRAMMVVMMAVMMVMTLLSATFFVLLFTVDWRSAKIQP